MTWIRGFDGLRAIAVAGVVACHISPGWGLGGWLGVDLFFVLSGYLITTLLVTEHERTGRIALAPFYVRRALRLYPALLFMVAVNPKIMVAGAPFVSRARPRQS